jgi:hypothetical protein
MPPARQKSRLRAALPGKVHTIRKSSALNSATVRPKSSALLPPPRSSSVPSAVTLSAANGSMLASNPETRAFPTDLSSRRFSHTRKPPARDRTEFEVAQY